MKRKSVWTTSTLALCLFLYMVSLSGCNQQSASSSSYESSVTVSVDSASASDNVAPVSSDTSPVTTGTVPAINVMPGNPLFPGSHYPDYSDSKYNNYDLISTVADVNPAFIMKKQTGCTYTSTSSGLTFTYQNNTVSTLPANIFAYTNKCFQKYSICNGTVPYVSMYKTAVEGFINNIFTVFYSNDNGKTWNSSKGISDTPVQSITGGTIPASDLPISFLWFVSKSDGYLLLSRDTVACGTGALSALYKTTDGGESWTYVNQNIGFDITGMNFTSVDDGFITDHGSGGVGNIYKTTDGGRTWKNLDLLSPNGQTIGGFSGGATGFYSPYFKNNVGYLPMICGDNEVLYFTSKDGGISWKPLS